MKPPGYSNPQPLGFSHLTPQTSGSRDKPRLLLPSESLTSVRLCEHNKTVALLCHKLLMWSRYYAEIDRWKRKYYCYYPILQMGRLSFRRIKQLDPGPIGSQRQSQALNPGLAGSRACSLPIILGAAC